MEILRVPPYADIDIEFTIPAGYVSNTIFSVVVTDMSDLSLSTLSFSGVSGDIISVPVSGMYDNDYQIKITDPNGVRLFDEGYEIRRPYIDPTTKGTTASEIAEYADKEELARAVIDSMLTDGFYYRKKTIEKVGLGSDYLPIWDDAKKVLKVYENNVLIYDSADEESYTRKFVITPDKSAITEYTTETINKAESARLVLPAAATDSIDLNYTYRGFPHSFDYTLVLEVGYPSVPGDIVKATELLIHDIACGKLDYYKRYVSAYNTDQFRIQFDKQVFEGTGNLIVDKILSKYVKSITKIEVL